MFFFDNLMVVQSFLFESFHGSLMVALHFQLHFQWFHV